MAQLPTKTELNTLNHKAKKHREKPFLGIEDSFPFGRYKGIEIIDMIEDENFSYIIWAAHNEVFEFSEEVLHEVGYF